MLRQYYKKGKTAIVVVNGFGNDKKRYVGTEKKNEKGCVHIYETLWLLC